LIHVFQNGLDRCIGVENAARKRRVEEKEQRKRREDVVEKEQENVKRYS